VSGTPTILPLMLTIGVVFGGLAAIAAYLISYSEYRQRMLRPDQRPARMAMGTAIATYAFFLVASIILAFVLGPTG
jgi:hypothetical protein